MSEKRIIKISPSGLNSIQTCFRAAYYNRVLGYDSIGINENLTRGTVIHSILELYYNNKMNDKDPLENIKECIVTLKELMSKEKLEDDTKTAITNSLVEYFGYYQNDSYKPLSAEVPFSFELHEDENVLILLEGKIDLITERTQNEEGIKYIFDHKSRSRDVTPILLQNQFMSYALATGIPNVVDNQIGLQKSVKTPDKFKRRVFSYTQEQLDEFADWAIYWVLTFDQANQRDHFPPNFSSCYNCGFRTVCESGKEFRLEKLEKMFVKRDKDFDIFGGGGVK